MTAKHPWLLKDNSELQSSGLKKRSSSAARQISDAPRFQSTYSKAGDSVFEIVIW